MGIKGLLRAIGPLLVGPDGVAPDSAAASKRECDPSSSPPSSGNAGMKVKRQGTHHIRQFAGRRLAVDVSAWLHRGAYSCSAELVEALEASASRPGGVEGDGEGTPRCIRMYTRYVLNRCDELLNHAGVASIHLVFDGRRCPLKAGTNEERNARKIAALEEARRLKRMGQTKEAQEKYKLCIKVTKGMERRVAKAVREKWGHPGDGEQSKVTCVFSPYEADAQLAALCRDKIADAVVTEDSDVLVYSASCGIPFPIIYKLDRDTGSCDVLTMDWLLSPTPSNSHSDPLSHLRRYLPCQRKQNSPKGRESPAKGERSGSFLSSLRCLSRREILRPGSGARLFVQACVLSGCDYAPSRLSGIGHVNSFKLVAENAHRKDGERFLRVLRSLPKGTVAGNEGDTRLTEKMVEQRADLESAGNERVLQYEELLAKSESVFYYHRVLDASLRSVVSLLEQPAETPSTDRKSRKKYLPCCQRFDCDLSFVGAFILTNEIPAPKASVAGPISAFLNITRTTIEGSGSGLEVSKAYTAVKTATGDSGGAERSLALLQRESNGAISSITRMVSEQAGAAYETWCSSASEKQSCTPSSSRRALKNSKKINPFAQFSRGAAQADPKTRKSAHHRIGNTSDWIESNQNKSCTSGCKSFQNSTRPEYSSSQLDETHYVSPAKEGHENASKIAASDTNTCRGVNTSMACEDEVCDTGDSVPLTSKVRATSKYFSRNDRRDMSRKVSLESSSATSTSLDRESSGEGIAGTLHNTFDRESEHVVAQVSKNVSRTASPRESLKEPAACDDVRGIKYHTVDDIVVVTRGSKEQPLVVDSDDEHIEDCSPVEEAGRIVLPQRQQDRLDISANCPVQTVQEHYISPFQSSQQARLVTPRSTSEKQKSMQRKASPLMAGFARQRELSARSELTTKSFTLKFGEIGSPADDSPSSSKKRRQGSSTINKYFHPLSTKQRRF
mmetsp:Transcript_53315/g.159649  ORF Transcript_53315/g.159649 Transcript_53315/m.159649 type:complete len:957 (-) Transcript_53315:1475-4345(-)|eukprot:CAMPEP_0113548780 /NCGR_PEP_ID=MMETSP0015_2-20120614/13072_1 /TAXON_ID=2838 /ORGANISM="Odontella" /LENGTH=956 /DNA_ID=CAMNT_0000449425 /DNA_START=346 /DNA_END=3216 /DNA_ORIENTATION=+ /assembly_acc=CAM_ASM_000160